MAGLDDYESLPELVRDSRLQTTWEDISHQVRIIHTRPVGHRARRREEIWVYKEHLGGGGFGSVSLQCRIAGTSDQPTLRAVKSIRASKNDPKTTPLLYVRELESLAKFSQDKYSDFFVKSYGWYDRPGQLHIAMEYCALGDLQDYLSEKCPHNRMPEVEVHEIAVQVLEALAMMHKERFAHRDLKPANILIFSQPPDHWWVKLCDLGLSKRIEDTTGYTTKIGTPNFMPPEYFLTENKEKVDNYSVDMWSFGETIFRALTSQVSFTNSQLLEYQKRNIGFPDQVLRNLAVSDDAINFLGSVMTAEPSRRLAADQAKNHPWIMENLSLSSENDLSKLLHDQGRTHAWIPDRASQYIDDITQASGKWSTVAVERHPPPGSSEVGRKREQLDNMDKSANQLYRKKVYDEAERQYRQIIELRTNFLGKEDPDTLKTLQQLARMLSIQNKHEEAEGLFRDTMELRIKVLGNDHPDTLQTMHNLAFTYHEQGKYDQAERLYRDTMERRINVLGNEHRDTLYTMYNLALTYDRQGKYDQGEKLYRDTMELRIKVLGNEHPSTLDSMNGLAYTYDEQGKYVQAEKLYRDTMELRIKVLGNDHRDTLDTMYNFARTYYNQGKYDQAERLYRDTMELVIKVLGNEHPDTIQTMDGLATTYTEQGKYDQAEKLYRDTMELKIKVLGNENRDTLDTMYNFARTSCSQGKYDQAERLYRDTMELVVKVLGNEHPNTIQTMDGLAYTYEKQGKHSKAERLYRDILVVKKKLLGRKHPQTMQVMRNLADVLDKQKKFSEAKEIRRKCKAAHS